MKDSLYLCIVHGVPPPKGNKGDPRSFFSKRFPRATINEFSFLDDSSMTEVLLYKRACCLLENLLQSWNPSGYCRLVFLAHGLGGCVVKQALLTAMENHRYLDIALHTSTTLFFGVPHRLGSLEAWEHAYLRLVSAPLNPPRHSLRLVNRIAEELEDTSASFATISGKFKIINFHESLTANNPLIDEFAATLGRHDETNHGFSCRHEELWQFVDGDPMTETAYAAIHSAAKTQEDLFIHFLHFLSFLDPHTHCLQPTYPPSDSRGWIDYKTFIDWRDDPSVGILLIHGPPGSGTSAISSQILGSLIDNNKGDPQNHVLLSFAFDANNIRAQTPLSLYISLCRQLLSSRPQLFRKISAVIAFLMNEGTLTSQSIWPLNVSLLAQLRDQGVPVFCIVDAIDDCIPIHQEEVVGRLERLVSQAGGSFKILLSRTDGLDNPIQNHGLCRTISATSSDGMASLKSQHVNKVISQFAQENAAWGELRDEAHSELAALPVDSPYLVTKLNMLLLGWEATRFTRRDIKRILQQRPKTLSECYRMAMATIQDDHRLWVSRALECIACAVRPLNPSELAVAVAVQEILEIRKGETVDLNEINEYTRSDIIGDLNHSMVTLIKTVDSQVHLIHSTLRTFLMEDIPVNDADAATDAHYRMLSNCLTYLECVGQPALEMMERRDEGRGTLPAERGIDLLRYASVNWPEHFRRTKCKQAARKDALRFLHNRSNVLAWADIYELFSRSLPAESTDPRTALAIVCTFGLTELVDDFISSTDQDNDFQDQMCESLNIAAQRGHVEVVRKLLDKGVRSQDALGLAARGGFKDVVLALVDVEVDVAVALNRQDLGGFTPLQHAVAGGHKDVVSLVLARGAEPDLLDDSLKPEAQNPQAAQSDSDAASNASKQHDSDSDNSSDRSESGSNASDWDDSSSDNNSSVSSANEPYSEPRIPIHLAALAGHLEIAQILNEYDADMCATDVFGYDALKHAVRGGFSDLWRLLLESGADITEAAKDGNTALHLAADHGDTEAVKTLLQHGSGAAVEKHIYARNRDGLSPTHLAARGGHLEVLRILWDGGEATPSETLGTGMDEDLDSLPASESSIPRGRRLRSPSSRHSRALPASESSASGNRRPRSPTTRPPRSRLIRRRTAKTRSPSPAARTIMPDTGRTKCELEWAAEHGHLEVVNAILDRHVGPSQEDRAYALTLASEKGHTEILARLLGSDLKTASTDDRKNTPIHLAAREGHQECLALLLDRRTGPLARALRVDLRNAEGMTPLHLAAKGGHLGIVNAIISRRESAGVKSLISMEDRRGRTALHHATQSVSSNCVEALLKFGADKDVVDGAGRTPLHHAARNESAKCIETLLQNGAAHLRDKYGRSALHYAAKKGSKDCVQALLEGKVKADGEDDALKTALHYAAEEGHIEVSSILCAQSPGLIWAEDNANNSAFDLVVRRGHIKEVEEFIRVLREEPAGEGGDQIRRGFPLHQAATAGSEDILRLLLEQGWSCDVNVRDGFENTPMHYVKSADQVDALSSSGAKIDERGSDGRTPLFIACWDGLLEVVKALLGSSTKPDLDTQSAEGNSLLHAACDNLAITELLLANKSNPNLLNNSGTSALAWATSVGSYDTPKVLLEGGADPNLGEDLLAKPLYRAAEIQDGGISLVKLLVESGADLLHEDSYGSTALNMAACVGDKLVIEYLIQKIGELDTDRKSEYLASAFVIFLHHSFEPEIGEIFIRGGVDLNGITKVNTGGSEPNNLQILEMTCSNARLEPVKWLVEKGADVNAPATRYGTTLCATLSGDDDTVGETARFLIDEGVNINYFHPDLPTAIQSVAHKGTSFSSLLDLLLDKGADINLSGGAQHDTPLNETIDKHFPLATVERFLEPERRADVSMSGKWKRTPLHIAAIRNRADVAQVLLRAGAAPLAKDDLGRSPLTCGLAMRSGEVVNHLLANGHFDPREVDAMGQTPLIVASMAGDEDIVNALLETDLKTMIDVQDFLGRTALVHATALDHLEIVKALIGAGADPTIVDCRGRGPLYWAVRSGRLGTLDVIAEALDGRNGDITRHWEIAVHGAIASNAREALERLLKKKGVDVHYKSPDNWTPLYTAQIYKSSRVESLLRGKSTTTVAVPSPEDTHTPADLPQRPSCWHPQDKFPCLVLDATDASSLTVVDGHKFASTSTMPRGIARADYPMVPLFKDKVFYFEVKITTESQDGTCRIGVGFCDDQAPLDRMLGWDQGSWGFHADDGHVFTNDGDGTKYTDPYTAGDVIGCGVNFGEGIAFFTKNGEVIGRAFDDTYGKLYPAVSINICQVGWKISAIFPGPTGDSPDFMFKGPYDGGETMTAPVVEQSESGSDE